MIGCIGGGSNFAGIAFPFLRENLKGGQRTRLLAIEPDATPSLTKGVYAYDFGDSAGMAPIVKMYTLGHDFYAAFHPCRWAAVSRHGTHALSACRRRADPSSICPPRHVSSMPQSSLPGLKAFCQRQNRLTPSWQPWMRPLLAKVTGEKKNHPFQPFRTWTFRFDRLQ